MSTKKTKKQPEWHEGLTQQQAAAISAAANRGDFDEAKRLMLAAGKEWQDAVIRNPDEKAKVVRRCNK